MWLPLHPGVTPEPPPPALRLPGKGEKQPSLVSPQEPKALCQSDTREGLAGRLKQEPKGSNLARDVGHGRNRGQVPSHSAKARLVEQGPGRGLPSPQRLAVSGPHPPERRWSRHQGLPGWRALQAAGLDSFPWCHCGPSTPLPAPSLRPSLQGHPQDLILDRPKLLVP